MGLFLFRDTECWLLSWEWEVIIPTVLSRLPAALELLEFPLRDRHTLEEAPELFVHLLCNLAPTWKDNCVSLCYLSYALSCRKTKNWLSQK